MTNEEVIRMLTRLKDQINFEWTDAQKKMDALNVAIETLSAEVRTQMSSADPVNRQDAIDALADYIHSIDKVVGTGHLSPIDCKDAAESVLCDLPSAERKAEWIHYSTKWKYRLKCSNCDYHLMGEDKTNFCPNCGARMEAQR